MTMSMEDFMTASELPEDPKETSISEPMTMDQFMGPAAAEGVPPPAPVPFATRSFRSLTSSLAAMNASTAKLPAAVYAVGAIPQNALARVTGWNIGAKPPEWMSDNPLITHFDKASEAYNYTQKQYPGEDLGSLIGKKDYAAAGDYLVQSVIQNAAQSLTSIALAASGASQWKALAFMGAQAGANTYADAHEKGVPELEAATAALINGSLEGVWEKAGTFGLMKEGKELFANVGEQTGKAIIKNTLKQVLGSVLGEGNEEMWTQLTQDITNKVYGVEDTKWSDMPRRAIEAGVMGAASGLTLTAPGSIAFGVRSSKANNQTQERITNLQKQLDDFKKSRNIDVGEPGLPPLPDDAKAGDIIRMEADEVGKALAEKYVAAGVDPDKAELHGKVEAARMTSRAELLGESLKSIAEREGLEIQRAEAPAPVEDVPEYNPPTATVRFVLQPVSRVSELASRKPEDLVSEVIHPDGSKAPITHQQIMDYAKGLAQQERDQPIDAIAQFIKDNGGVKGFRKRQGDKNAPESEEFKDVPLAYRGLASVDDMADRLQRAGFSEIRNGDDVRNHLRNLPKRRKSNMADHYNLAQRRLEEDFSSYNTTHDYAEEYSDTELYQDGLFDSVVENVSDRYNRHRADAIAQGMNPAQANKYASEKLAADSPRRPVADKPKQAEFGMGDGVAGFGQGRKGEGELFQNILYQSDPAPVWYSAVEKTLSEKMPAKASGEQILGMLKNTPGVKQEELDVIGLPEFLKGQKGSVDKQTVLDFVKQGGVKVEEVTRGRSSAEVLSVREAAYQSFDRGEITIEERNKRVEAAGVKDTKFDKYVLPGGEKYRELLFTLPPTGKTPFIKPEPLTELPDGYHLSNDKDGVDGYEWAIIPPGQGHSKPFTGLESSQAAAIRAALERINRDATNLAIDKWREENDNKNFMSGHFSEPNVLAHVRFNERTDAEGKRVLFIEEVQSDWHQAGRDKGYTGEIKITKEGDRWVATGKNGAKITAGRVEDFPTERSFRDTVTPGREVPDAPFKKTWHELTLKRMLRYAAENGFERVAWTTGEQQAERYDLSKQVEAIQYQPVEGLDGQIEDYAVRVIDKNGSLALDKYYTAAELPDAVGKELAQKIIANEGAENTVYGEVGAPPWAGKVLKDDKLKVGGEGMKGFYDQIIPSFLNKYTKKWGGRVSETRIPGVDREKVNESVSEIVPGKVHALDITPAMKDAVMAGQPLFQGEAQKRGSYDPYNNLISLFQASDESTPIHEGGHRWLEQVRDDYKFLIKKWRSEALNENQQRFVADVDNLLKWLGAPNIDAITKDQHEKFARGIEAYFREGKAPSPELQRVFDRFKEWLLALYKSIVDLDVELNPEIVKFMDSLLVTPKSAPAVAPVVEPVAPAKSAPVLEVLSPDIYSRNRKLAGNPPRKSDISKVLSDAARTVDEFVGVISTRLKNINPELKVGLRNFEFKIKQTISDDLKRVENVLKAAKKMSESDWLDFDLARKNRDVAVINRLADKYKLDMAAVRTTLDDLHRRARAAGFDIAFLENYHPRVVKDIEGILKYFYGDDARKSALLQAVQEKEAKLNRVLTNEEKVSIINTMLRGYDQGAISLSRTGNMKDREIEFVTPEINQFYENSDQALMHYIQSVNEAIAAREYFGKGAKELEYNNVNDSIGAFTLDLLEKGEIQPDQEQELRDILRARFNYVGTSGTIGLFKNLTYMDTLGSPISALTQLEDLGLIAYRAAFQMPGSFLRAVFNNSKITMQDLGIDTIAEELREGTRSATALRRLFKITGLAKFDRIGKETLVNAVIDKYRKQARNPSKEFTARLEAAFGKKGYQQVIDDLKAGRTTGDVQFLAFNELLEVQPVALSEVPQKYLENPNGRVFYTLKTFMIKRLDYYRNEIIHKGQEDGAAAKIVAVKRFLHLYGLLVAAGAGVDFVKDLLLGRETEIEDRVIDNFLKAFGLSKFYVYTARREGLASATARLLFMPPTKVFDAIYKDVFAIDFEEEGRDMIAGNVWNGEPLEIPASIPVGGKLYYWWWGKGPEKE